jgi:tetratricopeptide (TPR) repeat protein
VTSDHFARAEGLARAGRSQEAIDAYRRLLEIEPDLAQAHNNLGSLLASLGREADAIEHFERAVVLQPGVASTHGNLGVAFYVLGRLHEARAQFARQAEIEPGNAHALGLLGVVTLELGDVAQALQFFERALYVAPRSAWLYRRWAEATTVRPGDAALAAMEAIAANPAECSPADLVQLHFALGKSYDDLARYDEAFVQYERANRMHRQIVDYDETATLAEMTAARNFFTAGFMQTHAGSGDPSPLPVFVVGMPRSGTTLVEQLLAAHPNVFAAGEIGIFERVLAECGASDFERLGRTYVDRVATLAPHARRITDKMLANVLHLGAIHLALPSARIVHVRRDPVDTCLSCYFQAFMNAQPYSYDLGELGRYYRAYERLMQHWRDVFAPGVMLEIAYEDLVADFETVARAIVEHCGLAWDPACLAFHTAERAVRTASAAQVRRPLYTSSLRRSRRYRPYVGALLSALG